MLKHSNRAHQRKTVKARITEHLEVTDVSGNPDEQLEYSDPEIEETDDAPITGPAPCSLLDPLSDTIFRTALYEEASLTISCAQFLSVQLSMLPKHREVAVKWLFQLNYRFEFSSDAVYSAITFFDLVSMRMSIAKTEIQLYAAVCYCLAIKIDARTRPNIEELNSLTGQSFTNEQFVHKEVEILQVLAFKLSYPTIKFYIRMFVDALKPEKSIPVIVNFLTEIGLMKFQFLDFRQSTVALAAFVLGSAGIGFPDVAANAIRISHCENLDELIRCADLLRRDGESVAQNWKNSADQNVLDLLAAMKLPSDIRSLVSSIEVS
jgi:hypothetical protein